MTHSVYELLHISITTYYTYISLYLYIRHMFTM
jgi:hypothetical protein